SGLVALGTDVSAQTLPVPTVPSEEAPEAEPPSTGPETGAAPAAPAAPAEPPKRQPRREHELGLGGVYDSNVEFVLPDGPSGTALVPRGGFARTFRGRSSRLRFGAGGSWFGYPEQTAVNRYYGGVRLDGDVQSSRSTTWRISASYDYTYSDS